MKEITLFNRHVSPMRPLSVALGALLAAGTVRADTPAIPSGVVFVTSCDDHGPGTLREAVEQAIDGIWIDLEELACSTITLTTGALAVSVDSLTIATFHLNTASIRGPAGARVTGGSIPIVTIDAGGVDRVIDHAGSGTLGLYGLDMRNGSVTGNGGCISSMGDISLYLATVESCRAHDTDYLHGKGGGIYVAGGLRATSAHISGNSVDGPFPIGGGAFAGDGAFILQSVISDNTAISGISGDQALAGGLYARGYTKIYYSTVAGNRADLIGGMDLFEHTSIQAVPHIQNSTISGNSATRIGGIYAPYGLQLSYSTVAFNTALDDAGGIKLGANSYFRESIVARNLSNSVPSDVSRASSPGIISVEGAHNLIMASDPAVPPDTITLDPQLDVLADNGGPTPTHALLPGSPAIDAGGADGSAVPYFDQRYIGFNRVVGATIDIGAFEVGGGTDRIFCDGFERVGLPSPSVPKPCLSSP